MNVNSTRVKVSTVTDDPLSRDVVQFRRTEGVLHPRRVWAPASSSSIMMITRVRSAVSSIIGGIMASGSSAQEMHPDPPPPRFPYSRPDFLALSPDEVECSADHISRPILILKEMKLPWATGYAEWVRRRALICARGCCGMFALFVIITWGTENERSMTRIHTFISMQL